ncbi:MAG TPA: DNA repair protein RadC [Clostridiaceae bacterium]|jgi:DNA repair protein RadC|nr:DNA repair protein RadC [Clostridiaceae bacterium]
MTIKELPESERPYEKLQIYGANKLSNAELLSIIIKTGTKEYTSIDLANKVLNLNTHSNIRGMLDCSIEEFMTVKGIGRVKAIQLTAIGELAKRMSKPLNILNIKITSPNDVCNLLMDELKYEKREKVKVIILNAKNNILKMIDLGTGTTSIAIIDPKDVLLEAVRMGAPKIILIHNHPSGDPTPSIQDLRITKRLCECSKMLGIELLDHIVIGDGRYESIFSWEKKGLWKLK